MSTASTIVVIVVAVIFLGFFIKNGCVNWQ